jgi:hypothetical protein
LRPIFGTGCPSICRGKGKYLLQKQTKEKVTMKIFGRTPPFLVLQANYVLYISWDHRDNLQSQKAIILQFIQFKEVAMMPLPLEERLIIAKRLSKIFKRRRMPHKMMSQEANT